MAPARDEEVRRLEMALLEDSGRDWIDEGLCRAYLRSRKPHVIIPPLEDAIADLLARGLGGLVTDAGERHTLMRRFWSGSSDYVRAQFREVCASVVTSAEPHNKKRRTELGLAFAGLLILAERDGEPPTWRALDPRHVRDLIGRKDLPLPLVGLLEEIARFPASAGSAEIQRRFWAVRGQLEGRSGRSSPRRKVETNAERVARVLKASAGKRFSYQDLSCHPELQDIRSMRDAVAKARRSHSKISTEADPDGWLQVYWQE
jgi:hypothetical protein